MYCFFLDRFQDLDMECIALHPLHTAAYYCGKSYHSVSSEIHGHYRSLLRYRFLVRGTLPNVRSEVFLDLDYSGFCLYKYEKI